MNFLVVILDYCSLGSRELAEVIEMTNATPPPPLLIADDHGLDFLNSVAAPWGEQIEWLGDGQALLAWLEQAGLIPRQAAQWLDENASREMLEAAAAQARDLREWFRGFVAGQAGRKIDPTALADLDRLNRLLAGDANFYQIEPRIGDTDDVQGSPLQWRQHWRWRTTGDILVPLAQAMGDLLCQVNFERVKNCEGPKCTLWFHDTSKNHTRRWCKMAVCGNRAKAAAHRARGRADRRDG